MSSIFIYVNDENIESFKNNKSLYQDKIAFLGTTKKIITMNHEYGGEDNVIESVSVNGVSQTITNKGVNIDLTSYVTKSDLSSQSYLQSESDPTVPGHVKSITTGDISNWNNKVSNIQPDWNATTGGGSILNKPTDLADFNDDSTHRLVTDSEKTTWNGKQDSISDLTTIRSNAETGAAKVSNVQSDWNATTGLAVVLNKPTAISEFNTDSTHRVVTDTQITTWNGKQDSISDLNTIRTNAQLATTALQSFTEADPTVPSHVKSIQQSDITAWNSVSTKETPSNKVTSITSSSTDTEYPSAKAVQTKFEALDGSANIASVSNGVVTIKSGVSESDGIISNSSGTDITLHKIATTGSPNDITVEYNGTSVSLSTAMVNIKTDIDTAAQSAATTFYVCPNTANQIPENYQYYNGVTGTLTARNGTAGRVYLIKNGPDSYLQVIRTGTGNNNYAWTSLGSTSVDLTGLVKIITVNGKQYAVTSGTTLIDLGAIVTAVSGQTSINNANTSVVHVVATNTTNASTGENSVALEAQAQIGNVSSGTSGLATASDVKNYVDNKIIVRTWTSSNS